MQQTRSQNKSQAKTKHFDLRPVIWTLGIMGLSLIMLAASMVRAQDTVKTHGYSFYGDLTYPEDYPHFDYVNPDAPKGGEISIGTLGTFDSMHPYTRKGRAGALSSVMYESLLGGGTNAAAPADVYAEYYGLLAKGLEYDEGRNWVIFYMRPEARFSDGSPVTAHDIAFSHNLLLDEGLKSYADAVRKRIPKVEVIDDHTIKFYFTEGISRRSLIDQVGFVPAWSKKWYEETGASLNESRLEVSPGSGPYMIEDVDVNRRVVYKRNPDYWGTDLPFNVGRNNFDRIRIEYFGDDTARFEGFKAGEFTMRIESDSKRWATGYDFSKIDDGHIVKKELPDGAPATPSGIVFNLGRDVMQDAVSGGPWPWHIISNGPTKACNMACSNNVRHLARTLKSWPKAPPKARNWRFCKALVIWFRLKCCQNPWQSPIHPKQAAFWTAATHALRCGFWMMGAGPLGMTGCGAMRMASP